METKTSTDGCTSGQCCQKENEKSESCGDKCTTETSDKCCSTTSNEEGKVATCSCGSGQTCTCGEKCSCGTKVTTDQKQTQKQETDQKCNCSGGGNCTCADKCSCGSKKEETSNTRTLLISHHIDIGTKRTQEDTWTVLESLPKSPDWTFFGVYDGHGGIIASEWCQANMHNVVDGKLAENAKPDFKELMAATFVQADQEFSKGKKTVLVNGTDVSDYIGSTVCTLLLNKKTDELIVSNLGDTRAIVCRAGQPIQLSVDHSAEDKEEIARIEKSGHKVNNGRIDNIINVSRAIGDLAFKKNTNLPPGEQAISVVPEINVTKIVPEDEYLVIATDGLWTILDNNQTVEWVNNKLKEGADRKTIAKGLVDHALAVDGYDNITVFVVFLK